MKYRNDLKRRVLAGLFAGTALYTGMAVQAAGPAADIIANDTLPQGPHEILGDITIKGPEQFDNRPVMVITQTGQNGVIKWDSFNVGANAAVTFEGDKQGFNTLNYDMSGNMSQIYGAIDATNGGNIYIVNPAGVEIGSSAQINVGSLYVSNKEMDNAAFTDFLNDAGNDDFVVKGTITQDTVLMSLGNISATNVTFDGARIVIDTENLRQTDGLTKLAADDITVRTTDEDNVILGYDAYEEADGYAGANSSDVNLAKVNDGYFTKADGYMWIEDVEQLQAVNTNLGGNYALRSSIDATATRTWNDTGTDTVTLEGFRPIGMNEKGNVIVSTVTTEAGDETYYGFYGKFDGLGNHIFDLTIDRAGQDKVGLFGTVHDASISNVNLVSGSITGGKQVGGLIGAALGTTHVTGVTTGADVTGSFDVGGLIGYAGDFEGTNGNYEESKGNGIFTDLVNTGHVVGGQNGDEQDASDGNNVGGLVGYLYGGSLGGDSYNLGNVTTSGQNAGGLVGRANEAEIGDGQELVYNRLTVAGAYNVGGIVGLMENSAVQNAENSGTVTATGYIADGTYSYHTAHYEDVANGVKTETVYIANAGGIAGSASGSSSLNDVLNTGNVSSGTGTEIGYTYYTAGNVGGVVGSAVDTNITDATNQENEIRGAHNVGGIAGYFSGAGTLKKGVNDGGDILATGARNDDGFVKEWVRPGDTGGEETIIGNMGGVVGYMYGDDVTIAVSANRGTVHSQDITGTTVLSVSQAANVGGIVGKIDRSDTKEIYELGETYANAAVSNSYNTGDVRGYMGVGGVVGMMYNGEIAGSYNLGAVNTTRNAASFGSDSEYYSVNMGGVVGDTTENAHASALLYDVYNKGQVGDETFQYYARHVGGIVGRLSGTVEKAYNAGDIYNGYNVAGGIAGWVSTGNISNSFNVGNITVINNEKDGATSQIGGIAGAVQADNDITINNVYNLGTLRAFKPVGANATSLGGIIGAIRGNGGSVSITNAYTTGNIYAAKYNEQTEEYELDISSVGNSLHVGSIYGQIENSGINYFSENTYYIKPAQAMDGDFKTWSGESYLFPLLGQVMNVEGNPKTFGKDNSNHAINFADKDKWESYRYTDEENNEYKLNFSSQSGGAVDINENEDWRIYAGSTPILNAFLPNAEGYFERYTNDDLLNGVGIGSIQYGTAYDPLLTIINANGNKLNLEFNWQELKINNDAGLAVYGAGLTLNDFMSTGGSGYFGGLIYSDGVLTLNAHTDGTSLHDITGDVALGSSSQLYGSAVKIEADGTVTAYGAITATANDRDGSVVTETKENYYYTDGENIGAGDVSITGGEVNLYGTVNAAVNGEDVPVYGIGSMAEAFDPGPVNDPHTAMDSIGGRFSYVTHTDSDTSGNISIKAEIKEGSMATGDVNLYYGEEGKGLITTNRDLTVTAAGDIYSDSDLHVGGNITFDAPGEKVLDLTNIGKVRGESFMGDVTAALQQEGIVISNPAEVGGGNGETAISAIKEMLSQKYNMEDGSAEGVAATIVETLTTEGVDVLAERVNVNRLHEFLDHFSKNNTEKGGTIAFKNGDGSAADSSKITVDMWDYGANRFDLDQFDLPEDVGGTHKGSFVDKISGLNLSVAGNEGVAEKAEPKDYTYIWVSTGDQLAGIQKYYKDYVNDTENGENVGTGILGYNFALKNDIDASQVQDYQAIGVDSTGGFTGTFDGRDNRIMGLVVGQAPEGTEDGTAHAGLFDTIGESGVVKDVNIYSGRFTATQSAGAVAAVNKGTIQDVSLFSNRVEAFGSITGGTQLDGAYVGAAGGVAGVNEGNISDIRAAGIILAGEVGQGIEAAAGGLAGINSGTISESRVQSAVTADSEYTYALGGVAGVNMGGGRIDRVHSFGTVSGVYLHNHGEDGAAYSDQIGGIAGVNRGEATISNVYNAGRVSGRDDVGGIAGVNTSTGKVEPDTTIDTDSSIYNAVNSANIHGAAEENETSDNVGGLVGSNDGHITNGRNNGSVTGNQYVGGLVGENGADSVLKDLVNDSSAFIEGDRYVGGIAGSNAGEITVSALDENGQPAGNENAYLVNRGTITGQQYVGGVAGVNTGTIANTNNSVTLHVKDQTAEGADVVPQYFGGVVGLNDEAGTITNATNYADVNAEGAIYVGGIAGKNEGILENLAGNYGDVTGKDVVGGVAGENTAAISGVDVSNAGTVTATDGGAGGIIGHNTGALGSEDEETSFTNKGDVIGKGDSGTGGILTAHEGNITNVTMTNTGIVFNKDGQNVGGLIGIVSGENSSITGSVLSNDGAVIGEGNVGGIFGQNSADVSDSSMYNGVDGQVVGQNQVGGLIGQNTGDITGGRDQAGTFYDDKIYNNGVITVGTGSMSKKEDGTYELSIESGVTGESSQNIAGLFGTNSGKVIAAYNTGAVNAGNSQNVGGIAGTNTGTLDQVFNTVITVNEDGSIASGSITGSTNAGGIAGTNTGTISDAYNTTAVTGTTNTGSIAGINNGTIFNVYGTSDLVGNGSSSISNGYDISDTADNTDWKDSGSYGGFVFEGDDVVWKIYEGSTNPLLKVFLTKVTISEGTDLGLVYNGQDQDINLGDFISHTGISAADNFEAYQNNNSLIQNTSDEDFEHKNAGTYSNWLYSGQIAASSGEDGFNPNNLGYDIDFTQDIDQAKITISLDEIHRTYGNSQIHDGKDYGYSITGQNIALTDAMRAELEAGMTMDEESIKDDAVDSLADGKTYTNNAGDYTWSGNFSLGTDTGADSLANNYTFVKADGQFVDTITVSDGKSVVEKAQLTVNLNTVDRVYGETDIKNGSYGIDSVTGLVNGDEKGGLSLSGTAVIVDGALVDNGTRTNDVKEGGYTWNVGGESIAGNFNGIENLGTNYEITVKDGKSNVEQKEITINDLNASIVYGNQGGNGLVINSDLGLNGVVYGDNVSLSGNAVYTTGGSYDKNRDDRVTADAGKYEDSLFVRGLTLSGDKEGNYKLTMDEAVGDVEVTKAQLTVNVGKAETTYGTVFDSTKYEYTLEGIVNGDSMDAVKDQIGNVSYTNTAAGDGTDGKWTADAGTYEGGVGIAEESLGELTNYDITTVTKGMAVVNKAQISITVDDKEIYAGEALPEFTGTDIQEQLVNGDRIDTSYWYAPGSEVDTSVADSHGIGIHFGNAYYGESTQNANWPDVWTGFGNYTVTFTPGTLTVMDWPAGVEEPPVDEHWNFLFDDNPWDRNRDFRERKANIHFIAGGMTL